MALQNNAPRVGVGVGAGVVVTSYSRTVVQHFVQHINLAPQRACDAQRKRSVWRVLARHRARHGPGIIFLPSKNTKTCKKKEKNTIEA